MEGGWILSLVMVVVAVCAGLAALGFRGRITTVGIDLGTTFSVVGINKNGQVIIIEDKLGHRIFPSIVSYQDNGEILVAYDAISQLSKLPKNTIYNAKRFIGRSLEEEQVQIYASEHPFNVVPSSLSNYSKVGFKIERSGRSDVITPEQVGTEVLKFLLKITADYLGHNQVNKAVIAVPAKFDSQQRAATGAAYAAAGLKVMRVIEEPTAAAVAYKLHKKANIHHILVYDFGGGTLDVSLLYIAKGSVQVYATDGDETLGGSDFDLCLAKHIRSKVEAIMGKPIISSESVVVDGSVNEDELCILPSIHSKAEEIKKRLTYSDETTFSCIWPDSNKEKVTFHVSKQVDFEDQCNYLFERSLAPIDRLLTDLNMNKEDIDEIVLVGGSTRIPRVKRELKAYFGKALNDQIDPDVTVAYGAASILD